MFLISLKYHVLGWGRPSLLSPERILDCDIAVHSDGQQTEDGALCEHEQKAGDEQATVKVGTEPHTGYG